MRRIDDFSTEKIFSSFKVLVTIKMYIESNRIDKQFILYIDYRLLVLCLRIIAEGEGRGEG